MAAARIRFPSVCLRGIEADVYGGAYGVVWVEHGFDRSRACQGTRDSGGDSLAGHVHQHFVFELCRIGATLAHQIIV